MPYIEVDETTYQRLFGHSIGFDDTADAVLQRLMDQVEAPKGPTQKSAVPTTPAPPATSRRIRRGERTPQEDFCLPILRVLTDLGGKGSTQHVVDVVGERMSGLFTDADRLALPSGELRWRNTARWARKSLVNDGYLDPAAARGTWQLTESGRRYVRANG